ncbi:hypothetical protein KSF73_16355 [Burkholderiaceae bacterium DAT-1]|nr:hypothetical protein [Burkholderiaceae bacterium DAT-1]
MDQVDLNTSRGSIKKLILALVSIGCTGLLAGCQGDAPPPPKVSVEVYGARGDILTAVIETEHCHTEPSVTWSLDNGSTVGTALALTDVQPLTPITVSVSCGGAHASQTIAPQSVYASQAAFAVLQNGNVLSWGNPVWGGQTSVAAGISQIKSIYPSERGFAALLKDGSVRAWGSGYIAFTDPSDVDTATSPLTNIKTIIPGKTAYFALKQDGSFAAWGYTRDMTDEGYETPVNDAWFGLSATKIAALKNAKDVVGNDGAYAGITETGDVVPFGSTYNGGGEDAWASRPSQVTQVAATNFDLVAVQADGNIVSTWGFGYTYPGDFQFVSQVKKVVTNGVVGVALKADGTAMAFGQAGENEAADTSALAPYLTGVKDIAATQTAFAALKTDGTVLAWGDNPRMGNSLAKMQKILANVQTIKATEYAFAALRRDGYVITWGDPELGGDSSAVAPNLYDVVSITANHYAFAALRKDGTVVTWGMASKGGDSSPVASKLNHVRAIYSTAFGAFLAVKKDGSFVTWGDPWVGGGTAPASLTKIPYDQ